jgi:lipopolysaccharide assembly protein A
MQFLKTLMWVVLAAAIILFASANWDRLATIDLWGGLQVDVKLPVLVVLAFLLGFLPTLIVYRARLWALKRRLDNQGQVRVANAPGRPVRSTPLEAEPPAS